MRHRVEVTPTTPLEDLPQFLTIAQFAAFTQRAYSSVYEAVKSKQLRATTLGGKQIFIPRSELQRKLEEAEAACHA